MSDLPSVFTVAIVPLITVDCLLWLMSFQVTAVRRYQNYVLAMLMPIGCMALWTPMSRWQIKSYMPMILPPEPKQDLRLKYKKSTT